MGTEKRKQDRIAAAIFAYFVSGGILLYVAKEIRKGVEDPYPGVEDPEKKLERAKKSVAPLSKEIDAVDRAREELSRLSRST
ncbi:hypothetical protein BJF83_02380 [Nocardiopsis sp. CNR-923]|uniref:hypothetical protein n=1 Tax=Nocardiopsis sp. CNR-923 TaxID=1904965 RepID=UPI000959313C|nr:hypothetical protein [Nocardiopsis sp. CNR-923]OLT27421.1 hypothetical protein BJF83_02380 [Nocardiopsis sp. CNR-923]